MRSTVFLQEIAYSLFNVKIQIVSFKGDIFRNLKNREVNASTDYWIL